MKKKQKKIAYTDGSSVLKYNSKPMALARGKQKVKSNVGGVSAPLGAPPFYKKLLNSSILIPRRTTDAVGVLRARTLAVIHPAARTELAAHPAVTASPQDHHLDGIICELQNGVTSRKYCASPLAACARRSILQTPVNVLNIVSSFMW